MLGIPRAPISTWCQGSMRENSTSRHTRTNKSVWIFTHRTLGRRMFSFLNSAVRLDGSTHAPTVTAVALITKVAPRLANLRNLLNFARSGWHLITPGDAWKDLIGLSGLARRVKIVTQNKIKVYQLSCTLIRAHQFSPDALYSIRYCQESIIHIRSSSIFIVFVNKM